MAKQVVRKKGVKEDQQDKGQIRRRNFTYACIFSFLGRQFPHDSSLLFPSHVVRTQEQFYDRVSGGFRFRDRHAFPAKVSNLGSTKRRAPVCDLCPLHASGLHARLGGEREQIQMSLPWKRVRPMRASTLRGRHHALWTGPNCRWMPRVRSWSMSVNFFRAHPGPPAPSTTVVLF